MKLMLEKSNNVYAIFWRSKRDDWRRGRSNHREWKREREREKDHIQISNKYTALTAKSLIGTTDMNESHNLQNPPHNIRF